MRTLLVLAFSLSILSAQTTPPLRLSLDEAIQRGLKNNLGVLERETTSRITRAARTRALSALLPNVTGAVTENVQQTNIVGSSRVDLQACKLEYSIVSPK